MFSAPRARIARHARTGPLVAAYGLALALAPLSTGAAAEVAAIVEAVKGGDAGLRFMDYLVAGRVIDLGTDGVLVLGYLQSCEREVITGGRVTVGSMQSVVRGGSVKRERVECDGGRLILAPEGADKGAVVVFRRPPGASAARSDQRIYALGPFIKVTNGARRVRIVRLDRPGKAIVVEVGGGFADLAERGVALQRGGLYRALAKGAEVVFRVDESAVAANGPIVGRLVHF